MRSATPSSGRPHETVPSASTRRGSPATQLVTTSVASARPYAGRTTPRMPKRASNASNRRDARYFAAVACEAQAREVDSR